MLKTTFFVAGFDNQNMWETEDTDRVRHRIAELQSVEATARPETGYKREKTVIGTKHELRELAEYKKALDAINSKRLSMGYDSKPPEYGAWEPGGLN